MVLVRLLLACVLVLPATVAADTLPAPSLKLVSAGTGKRKLLRFTPAKGTKRTIVMTSQEAKARGMAGKLPQPEPGPRMETTIDVEVTDVTAGGDVHYTFAYRKVELLGKQRVPLAAFGAVKATAVTTNRGVTKQIDFAVPTDATDEVRQAFAMARGVATQLAQPLPEEAVGVGAKWRTSSTATVGEVTAQTTATYELAELTGNRAKLKITVAVDGKGSGPGNLTTKTTGRGEAMLDLASVVPVRGTIEMRTEVGLDFEGGRLGQLSTTKSTLVTR